MVSLFFHSSWQLLVSFQRLLKIDFLNRTKLFTLKLKHYFYMMNSSRTCKNSIAVFPRKYFECKMLWIMQQIYRRTPLQKFDFNKSQVKLHHRVSRVNLLYNSRVFVYIWYQRHVSYLITMHFCFTDITRG